jgi:hypothetical protein
MRSSNGGARSDEKRAALDHDFTVVLEKTPNPGGWADAVMPGSAEFFGTGGLVKVRAPSTGVPSGARLWRWATASTSCR